MNLRRHRNLPLISALVIIVHSLLGVGYSAPPLPLSTSYWKDPEFRKAFNGSYRIEARIEPVVSSEERGLLVEVQELMEGGRREAALEKVRGSSLTAKSAALQFNLGNLRFEEGELEKSAEAYEAAIAIYPSFRRAHRNLGMVRVRLNDTDEGLGHLVEAVRLGDSEGVTYGLLAYCRLQRGEWASALQAYRMAQLSEPDSPEWKAGVAQCLENLNARDEAVALLDEVIRRRPEESSYAVLQAGMLLDLGRPEDAVKELELPRRLGRLDADGLLMLGDLHLRASRVDDARARVDEAFDGEGKPSEGRILSAVASAMARSEWELSRLLIERATPEQGEAPRPLRRAAARLKIESGEAPEQGAEELVVLLGEDPTDGAALLALGRHRRSAGQAGEAELLFERATAVDEVAADAWIEIARLRVDESRYEAALEAVDRALERRPGGSLEAYRESLARLVAAAR